MEPPPMILPKGIVFNIDRVYKEVAAYPVVPPEKIYEYWHVYTTTFGKLKDPTASRLENFWWHVLGSDRRSLSGATLARLFEHISNGPTFVRLKGPPNRYEGPSSPSTADKSAVPSSKGHQPDSQQHDDDNPLEMTGSMRPIQSSSSKPPPAHPILKKPRGPSTSGPRPTARFVSPHQSEAEDDEKESSADSSTSAAGREDDAGKRTSNSAPAKEKQKKSSLSVPKKKAFVASSSSKRRPAMPRRQSSQSSATGSEVGSREERPSLTTRFSGSQRPVSPIAEKPHQRNTSKSRDSDGSQSAKAAGKRPAGKVAAAQPTPPRPTSTQATSTSDRPAVVLDSERNITPPRGSPNAAPREKGKEPLHAVSGARDEVWAPHRRSDAQERIRPEPVPPSMARSRSDVGSFRGGEMKNPRRVPPQGLTSTSTATTSNVAAQGTIIEFDDNAPARAVASAIHEQQDSPEMGLRRSGSTVTLTPTAPSKSPAVPLGRSKSQLTLLLERQGEKKPRR
ncbi:uncharacterized protein JN550_001444 [Neoarthrinium moseri]|uniref:uncharacterized protein n=1 Tax=Neoarthrinium moseri TaxID=1658444 RepID=UPI001FDE33D8|nr:uncharacterized protein JN550_001444 [Neoarthrinium moseri]KAI1875948.1 hypothetical protein JN550_001444 [Neoarthrinium moseri]